MIFKMLLVSGKSLQTYGSSAHITLMARPGPKRQKWNTLTSSVPKMFQKYNVTATKSMITIILRNNSAKGLQIYEHAYHV